MLVLRDFTFIEHLFFDKIAIILTKLRAKILLKLLQLTYNSILLLLSKFPQNRRKRNRETISTSRQQPQMKFELLTDAGLPRLTSKHETPDKVSSMYQYSWFETRI